MIHDNREGAIRNSNEKPHSHFEVAGLGAMTQLTELCAIVPFAHEQGDLQSLADLRRLALESLPPQQGLPDSTTYHPFVFPEAASITKLSMNMHIEVGSTPLLWAVPPISIFEICKTNNLLQCALIPALDHLLPNLELVEQKVKWI